MNRMILTSQEVAALLRGLSQGESELSAEPESEVPRPPAGPGLRESCGGQGLRKISHWWAAFTEPKRPQF